MARRAWLDRTGFRYGRLLVLGIHHMGAGKTTWLCQCDCGETTVVVANQLGRCKNSCGCLRRENRSNLRHGQHGTPTYEIWKSMRGRCKNVKNKYYASYGGRGIFVCDEWGDFNKFVADMGEKPKGRWSLDRIDNDGPYSKENCRWANDSQQARNKRSNSGYTHNGVYKIWAEWADDAAVSAQLLRTRVVREKWDFERALKTPARKMRPSVREPHNATV